MGWGVAAVEVAGAFIGYKYLSQDGKFSEEDCSKIQCKAVSGEGKGKFPALSDEQKVAVSDAIKEMASKAEKIYDTDKTSGKLVSVVVRDGSGAERSFAILSADTEAFSARISRIGISVTSVAAGLVIQGGMGLLDPDVMVGVKTIKGNLERRKSTGDQSIGISDHSVRRNQLDDIEKQEKEMFQQLVTPNRLP